MDLPFDFPAFEPGHVWLVGAGPGDPGLLSLLAVHALRNADSVVYDALVDERILKLARDGARLEFAGKRGGKPSPRQPDISRRLVELARAGERVLRLKGGDPFVFGRGAEEASHLAGESVPFRIVPGITAGIGGLAYAGIPATARDVNQAVTFVTGHSSSGEVPDAIDWPALARGSPVIVFYMALRQIGIICDKLIECGRDPAEPVALISRASTPAQKVVVTDLAGAAAAAAAEGLEPPAMVVVGGVVAYRKILAGGSPCP